MAEYILKFNNITKKYPGVTALKNVSLGVKRGEILALAGENGAGKSTLIKCCTGAVVPDEGELEIDGKKFSKMTPNLADENGLVVIYQELNSVNDLSVAENVFLGNEIKKGLLVDMEAMIDKTRKIFADMQVEIDPKQELGTLSTGYKQMVEIAKALSHDARILIMDEPSASLTNSEIEKMFQVINNLKNKGVTIIYITHRMNEIFEISDRVAVMRDGEMITTLETKDVTVEEIIRNMVGREMNMTYPQRTDTRTNEIILELRNVCGNGVSNVSFKLNKGELLGIAGLIGAGRTELAKLIFGAARKTSGEIIWKGKSVDFRLPNQAIKEGIYLVPEDRKDEGAFLQLDVMDNITISSIKKLSDGLVLNEKKRQTISEKYKAELDIKTPSMQQQVKNLSGGNQQKVIVAKALATDPDLIIFDEPTRGIDVAAKHEIYVICNELLAEGKTIIMISSEMEELLGMCDRLLVMAEGHLSGTIEKSDFSQQNVMRYASQQYVKD